MILVNALQSFLIWFYLSKSTGYYMRYLLYIRSSDLEQRMRKFKLIKNFTQ
jgi:hypothetical protein